MTDKERHIKLRELLQQNGSDFLADKRLFNILNDSAYFKECPRCRSVFATVIEENYANMILSYTRGDMTKDEVFPQIVDGLQTKHCYNETDVSNVLQSIMFGLNIIDNVDSYNDNNDLAWLSDIEGQRDEAEVDEWNSEYVIINVTPADADILIDYHKYNAINGTLVTELGYGVHNYRISAPMHHSSLGQIKVVEGKQQTVNIDLTPSYGTIHISTQAKDATIYIDGKCEGNSPVRLKKISSGKHLVSIKAPLYFDFNREVIVFDGETSVLYADMEPNFGSVVVKCDDKDISISIDGTPYGKGGWVGNLSIGNHVIEVSKPSHFSETLTIEVKRSITGKPQIITLPELKPYYGGLKVNVLPVGSKVFIDGKQVGTTPYKTKNILVGRYKLEVKCPDLFPLERTILVQQGKFMEVNDVLSGRFNNDLSRAEIGDYIYEDGTWSAEYTDEKVCLGIVFTLETTEEEKKAGWTHGQIISLKSSREEYMWSQNQWKVNQIPTKSQNGTSLDKDGYKNTKAICSLNSVEYPAFTEGLNYLPQSKSISSWYIPTMGQMFDVYKNLFGVRELKQTVIISECHYKINMARIKELDIGRCWTSSQVDALNAWYAFHWKEKNQLIIAPVSKNKEINVRGVAAF